MGVKVYSALVGVFALTPPVGAEAAEGRVPVGPEICYVVADSSADAVDGKAEDLLTRVTRADPDPATNEVSIGTGTGTFNIEAMAVQPGTGVVFAADGGDLGTLDTTTGLFAKIGPVGSGAGRLGTVEFEDLDGLSFDATTGLLYGAERRASGEDLLLRLDPTSGSVVPGGVTGRDYVVVPAVAGLPDIDDIAVDPSDGQMYGIANDDGRRDRLVRIDKATGATSDVGAMAASDMEGLSFAGGQLIGTTGKNLREEGIWDIDKATGEAGNRRPLDNGRDYEAFACLNAPNPLPPAGESLPPGVPAPPVAPVEIPERSEPVGGPDPGSIRTPAGVVLPPPPAAAPVAAPELPRTGAGAPDTLARLAGLGLALGGLAIVGGTRRRRRYPVGLDAPLAQTAEHFHGKEGVYGSIP